MGLFDHTSEQKTSLTRAIEQPPTFELKKHSRAILTSSWRIVSTALLAVVYEILNLFISVAMFAGAIIANAFGGTRPRILAIRPRRALGDDSRAVGPPWSNRRS